MDHLVLTKEEFGDLWSLEECGDIPAAKRKVLEATKKGATVRLAVEVPFSVELKVGEPGGEGKTPKTPKPGKSGSKSQEELNREADQSQSEQDQNSGD